MSGEREHAEALRGQVAELLAPLGLTLSLEKTHVVGIDDGFDFLGFHIRRMRKRGTMKSYVYTVPAPQGHRGRVQLRSDPLPLPRQPDPNPLDPDPHTRNQRMTNDQDTWRVRCLETGTSGSAGADGKTDYRKVARRFIPDPTRQLRHVLPRLRYFLGWRRVRPRLLNGSATCGTPEDWLLSGPDPRPAAIEQIRTYYSI